LAVLGNCQDFFAKTIAKTRCKKAFFYGTVDKPELGGVGAHKTCFPRKITQKKGISPPIHVDQLWQTVSLGFVCGTGESFNSPPIYAFDKYY
jgi:hypothetical protein